jgi:hypothetical protein
VSELGKGVDDRPIAQYSLDTDRVIVTYDDDFVLDVDDGDYRAVMDVGDATLPIEAVADTVSEAHPQTELRGREYVGEEWL